MIKKAAIVFTVIILLSGFYLYFKKDNKMPQKTLPIDTWRLISINPNNKYGTYVANGLISTRVFNNGVGNEDGKPCECYLAGFYDCEKLIPIPTWSDLRFHQGNSEFKLDKSADYKQVLDMKTGILTTSGTWRSGNKTLAGSVDVIAARHNPNLGIVTAKLTADFDGEITAESSLGNLDQNLQLLSSAITPVGTKTAFITKDSKINLSMYRQLTSSLNNKSIKSKSNQLSNKINLNISANKEFEIYLVNSIASSKSEENASKEAEAALKLDIKQSEDNISNSITSCIEKHKLAWSQLWKKDILIDGSKKDQQAIRSCMFYLLQSVRENSQWSIPPMGLSSRFFNGHIFWDADTWIFPALLLQHPELAKSIVDYRYNTLQGAIKNAKKSGCKGAEYAWESGYTGIEDTPSGMDSVSERHINGDVALAQWQYYLATDDKAWLKNHGYPVLKATADYWVSRAVFAKQYNRYEILNVMPPDENAGIVNNSVYTNAIAKLNLQIAEIAAKEISVKPDLNWNKVAGGMYIPFDMKNKRFICRDGVTPRSMKQADVELLIYPLQFSLNGDDINDIWKNTYNYYSKKVIPTGPAMTSSAHSVIASRLGDTENAYEKFKKSYEPFFRGDFNYFNEKRSKTYENMYFHTGAAGPLAAVFYGFGGIEMDYKKPGKELKMYPKLPAAWKSLTITGIKWRGKEITLKTPDN